MKKYFLNCMTIMMVAMLSVNFTSCNGDEDDGGPVGKTVENLVGLWQMANVKGTSSETGGFNINVSTSDSKAFEDLDIADFVRYQFDADNKFTCYTYSSGKDEWRVSISATYKLNGETLILGDKTSKPESLKIVSLTSNQLVLHYVESDGDDYLEMDVTMNRIK